MEMAPPQIGRALVVVVDDRVSHGEREDSIGPLVTELLEEARLVVDGVVVVPGDPVAIRNALNTAVIGGVDLVVTVGGTGVSPRDVTADATAGVLDRPIPGIAEAIRASGLAAGAVDAGLSRGLVGVSGSTLVVNLAPSRAAVRDGMATLTPLVAHVIAELSGAGRCARVGVPGWSWRSAAADARLTAAPGAAARPRCPRRACCPVHHRRDERDDRDPRGRAGADSTCADRRAPPEPASAELQTRRRPGITMADRLSVRPAGSGQRVLPPDRGASAASWREQVADLGQQLDLGGLGRAGLLAALAPLLERVQRQHDHEVDDRGDDEEVERRA